MIIIPAIDIKDGKCVRLYQGDFSSCEIVSDDPVSAALKFKECGAEYIHIVDLDGARYGSIKNLCTIRKIIKAVNIPIEFGGGVRNMGTVYNLLDMGIARIILGTGAVNDEKFLKDAVSNFKSRIAVGIDVKNQMAATNGWEKTSAENYIDFAKYIEECGVQTVIVTDIKKDGTLKGPDTDMISELKKAISINIIASGGTGSFDDLKKLADLNIYGAIVGKAFYSGKIKADKEVFNAFKENNSMS